MNMTNNDTRSTLKTGFINNTTYTYNEEVAVDILTLTQGTSVINTRISYTTALYIVLKQNTTIVDYALADYPSMISSYNYTSPIGVMSSCLRITLPIINSVQQVLPADGSWTITLYNYREEQRQSLSNALKPKADL